MINNRQSSFRSGAGVTRTLEEKVSANESWAYYQFTVEKKLTTAVMAIK